MSSDANTPTVTVEDLKQKLKLIASGKVRDIFEIDEHTLLFVASDRISAYDVIMKNGVPEKGKLLTAMSDYWFQYLSREIPNLKHHLISTTLPESLTSKLSPAEVSYLTGRSMVVRRLQVLPIESIVRGYITGSGWAEYQKNGTVHGIPMPKGLQESQKLEQPLWTPSTKAELGQKDENIHPDQAASLIGEDVAKEMERLSLEIYTKARDHAARNGIILADTKFEFGIDPYGPATTPPTLYLIDEVLTPDSSRYWPADGYEVGKGQSSFDKQFLRDWLTTNKLKGVEGVEMPPEIVQKTSEKYKEAYEKVTGKKVGA